MKAILFPGQGSQIVGMGSEFFKNFEIVKKIFDEADNTLNFKISKTILEGPENELKLTANTQPAILTVSYAIFSVLKKEFNYDFSATKFFAGHSLGEYSALVCADSLVFKDAIFLLHERGKSMQEAVSVGKGGMLAVLGLDLISINNYINEMNKKGAGHIYLAKDRPNPMIEANKPKKKPKKKKVSSGVDLEHVMMFKTS